MAINLYTHAKAVLRPEISWTMVFLNFESTMYRIDILKFPEDMDRIALQTAMHIENEHTLEKIDDGAYFGKNHENFIIRFIENPLNLELSKQLAGEEFPFFHRKKIMFYPTIRLR